MRGEGLTEVSGNIVLERVPLLHEELPAPTAAAAVQREPVAAPDPRRFHEGALLVAVRPTGGERAEVSVQPRPLGMTVLNDVFMSPRLWVRGRWDAACGQRDIAFVRPLAAMKITRAPVAAVAVSNAQLVASLWAQAGGKLRGRVIETQRRLSRVDDARALEPWSSQLSTQLPDVIREMNKNSNNSAARHLFLALSPIDSGGGAQREAQSRMQAWLRGQGLADGDVSLDVGSGQSHLERGKPHALVHLLRNAWRASAAQAFLDSLPIAGVDGTLAQRMRHGAATGQAFLKTGTLRDTRALAGYVRARSGKVYAVAALVNHPEAVRAMPALDKFIEWVANNG
jgi:D-alanyl-D-alanine carboxypeptidase/D-alanyl-D-alanine-endopeptidase (penicillin-binding protein 4)